MLEDKGIDTNRFFVIPVSTVQELRTQSLKILSGYLEVPKKDRLPMFMVLDSLGQLSTTKEMQDSLEGKETADMTRARLIKATFRTITLKLAKAKVPFVVTNHVYSEQGTMFPQKVMSGGTGLYYSASTLLFLSKAKDKDGKDVVGNFITCTVKKGRVTKENSQVKLQLSYETGLNKYYGLLELGEKYGIFKRLSTKWEFPMGDSAFEKHIYKNGEKWFTPEILKQLDEAAHKEFYYGRKSIVDVDDTEEDNFDDFEEDNIDEQ